MPKYDIDYQKSIIYKLCCKDPTIEEIYIGSTTNFTNRKRLHKNSCHNVNNHNFNYYVYKYIRLNGGWINWDMIEIEKHPCDNSNDLHKRERYYIETLKAGLNKQIPTRTWSEYYEENKEQLKEYQKHFRHENKAQIKQYREENKDQIKQYQKQYQKKYRENNKVKLYNNMKPKPKKKLILKKIKNETDI